MPEFLTEYLDGLTEGLLITLKQPDAYLNKIALTATIILVGLLVNILFKRLFMVNYKQGTSTKTDLQRAILAVFEKNKN